MGPSSLGTANSFKETCQQSCFNLRYFEGGDAEGEEIILSSDSDVEDKEKEDINVLESHSEAETEKDDYCRGVNHFMKT